MLVVPNLRVVEPTTCIAARHTATAASCGVKGRKKAVLNRRERGSCLKAPLASAARCSGAPRGRQTARGFLFM